MTDGELLEPFRPQKRNLLRNGSKILIKCLDNDSSGMLEDFSFGCRSSPGCDSPRTQTQVDWKDEEEPTQHRNELNGRCNAESEHSVSENLSTSTELSGPVARTGDEHSSQSHSTPPSLLPYSQVIHSRSSHSTEDPFDAPTDCDFTKIKSKTRASAIVAPSLPKRSISFERAVGKDDVKRQTPLRPRRRRLKSSSEYHEVQTCLFEPGKFKFHL